MSISKGEGTIHVYENPRPDLALFGMRQWIYESEKGKISLVSPSWVTGGQWEICCLEGDLFDDVERFPTKEEAEERIRRLLR